MIRNSSGAHIGLAAPIEAREAMRAAFASIKPAPVRTVRRGFRFPVAPAAIASGFALSLAPWLWLSGVDWAPVAIVGRFIFSAA